MRTTRDRADTRVWPQAGRSLVGMVACGAIVVGVFAGCAGQTAATTQPLPVRESSEPMAWLTAAPAPTTQAASTALTRERRDWPLRIVRYEAANNWHWPLWFEDAPLERYGCSLGDPFQPFFSVGLAGIHFLALPYSAVRRPPWQQVYPSDWPKDPPPACMMMPPFDPIAGLAEAGVVIGLIALVP